VSRVDSKIRFKPGKLGFSDISLWSSALDFVSNRNDLVGMTSEVETGVSDAGFTKSRFEIWTEFSE